MRSGVTLGGLALAMVLALGVRTGAIDLNQLVNMTVYLVANGMNGAGKLANEPKTPIGGATFDFNADDLNKQVEKLTEKIEGQD